MKPYEEKLFSEYLTFRMHKRLLLYLSPLIFIVGFIGNTLSVVILTRRQFRRVATYTYLTAVSAADTLVLIFGLLRQWLSEITDIDPTVYADWTCKTIMVLNYSFSVYSVWLLIAVTVERYLVVSRPLRVQGQCTRRRAVVVIVFLLFVAMAINVHFAWTLRVEMQAIEVYNGSNATDLVRQCNAPQELDFAVNVVWPWIDLFVYLLVPFVIIVVLNSIIIYKVVDARRRRGGMSGTCRSTGSHRHHGGGCADEMGVDTRLAIMLVTVSFTFLLLTLPMCVWQSIKMLLDLDRSDMSIMSSAALATTISRLLMYTNHAANFYLYCATGRKFRRQLYAAVGCCACCLATDVWTGGFPGVNHPLKDANHRRSYSGKNQADAVCRDYVEEQDKKTDAKRTVQNNASRHQERCPGRQRHSISKR